ncbi:MAG: helix-turn-helix transcriptional regulator [Caldilineaceae bacterium]
MNNQTSLEEVNSFGEWLRQRRKTLDWSQALLAQRAGCTAAMIRKIEADERKPSWQLAELLATVLGIPADRQTAFVQAARQLRPVTQLPPANQAPVVTAPFPLASPKFLHNLPSSMTSLVDRVRDAATVVQLLSAPTCAY